jgi:hypothetical protein
MAKRLIDKLRDKKARPWMAFQALWGEIDEALAARASAREIWMMLQEEGRFEGCYETFNRYVRKMREAHPAPGANAPRRRNSVSAPLGPEQSVGDPEAPPPPDAIQAEAQQAPPKHPAEPPKEFKFDPFAFDPKTDI